MSLGGRARTTHGKTHEHGISGQRLTTGRLLDGTADLHLGEIREEGSDGRLTENDTRILSTPLTMAEGSWQADGFEAGRRLSLESLRKGMEQILNARSRGRLREQPHRPVETCSQAA